MDYGCDVSNRYTGYLDSDDHGTLSNDNKNKRKMRKKRKSKNQNRKLLDQNINTEQSNECHNKTKQSNESNCAEPINHNTTESVEIGHTVDENQQSFPTDNGSDANDNVDHNKPLKFDTEPNITDVQKSSSSCDSPIQSNVTLDDEVKDSTKNNTTMDHLYAQQTKWSEICFEEEKSLMASESHLNQESTNKALNEPELMYNEHRVYPTIYFYNSNFGYRHRRTIDWHDSGRRSRNEDDFKRTNETNRKYEFNNQSNETSHTNVNEKKPKRYNNQYRNRKQKSHRRNDSDDSNQQCSIDYPRSDDEKQTESNNGSNVNAPQPTNEYNNEQSNRREYVKKSQNRYNKFKHGMPEQTFTRRRRPDFVRNV